jgi:hypothetical protein
MLGPGRGIHSSAAFRHQPRPPHARAPLADYASVAHVARIYDYLLGGKDNFAADRKAAQQAVLI